MIIAIDGPAASGKGTLARALARHFGLPHLDTGAIYRAAALRLLDSGERPEDMAAALAAAQAVRAEDTASPRLRADIVAETASRIAALPAVRAALLENQRAFARQPGGAVLDGRDIGTVICPEADVKVFVTASPEERARRRFAELSAAGGGVTFEEVLADIRRRDARDAERSAAPLARAPDALLLDTDNLDAEAAFRTVLAFIRSIDRARS